MTSIIESWFHRKRVKSEVLYSGRKVEARRVTNPYHAVGISAGRGCCQAVGTIQGQRFLSAEAPALPVKGCDAATCSCRYVHFEDRRVEEDRRRQDVWNIAMAATGRKDRRANGGGRRHTD